MSRLLCLIGRHDWRRRRDRVADANGGRHRVCARCGRERVEYKDPPATGVLRFGNGMG